MDTLLLIPLLVAFFITFLILPIWISKAKKIKLVWKDMNKKQETEIAGSGGLIVVLGFLLAVLIYVAIKTFYFHSTTNLIEIFALLTSVLILSGIGIIDDLLGWHQGGLTKKFRMILCLFAAIPLMVINAGVNQISFPIIDGISLGLLYPLFLIPLGIIGAATTFNFLAGFNGLEAGNGILVISAISLVAYLTGNAWLALIGLIMVFSLLAFLIFNMSPSKIFPGDVLTYPIGGLIAIIAIFGNFEKIAVFFFIPYILETCLKVRGKLKKYSFAQPQEDNSLELKYNKIYSLNHLAIFLLKKIKNKVYEKDVVLSIWLFQLIIILLGFLIFKNTIF